MSASPRDIQNEEEEIDEDPSTICNDAKVREEGTKLKYRHRKRQIYAAVRKQMEFYFSDANIRKDRMMKQIVQEQEFIDLSVFLSFNKIAGLCKGISDLQRALKESEKLELSEDMNSVKRKIPFDEAQSKSDEEVENCTIYVENIPSHVGHDWIEEVFQEYGAIAYISLPKYKRTFQNKGFAFVEYEHEEEAKRCLEAFGEMGACLSSTIEPSSLASINSYVDSQNNAPQSTQNSNRTSSQNVISQDLSTSQSQPDFSESSGSQLSAASLSSKSIHKRHFEEGTATDEGDGDNSAKRRKLEDDVAGTGDCGDRSEAVTINQSPSKELDSHTDVSPVISQGLKKKPKRRKQKKIFERVNKQEKLEVESIQLRILPKKNWRQLRNKYLNMQRESMAKLKRQMKFQQFTSLHYNQPCELNLEAIKTTPSVCIKIELDQPAKSVEVFKAQIELEATPPGYTNLVRFVDYQEGALDAIVRLASSEQGIKKFIANASKIFSRVTRFTNEETANYWKSVKVGQNLKKKQQKEKVRGKDKLLNRAEKLTKSHIRFDDDEELHQGSNASTKVKSEHAIEPDHQHASQ